MGIKTNMHKIMQGILLLMILCIPAHTAFAKSIGVIMTGDIPYYQDIHKAFLDDISGSLSQEGIEIVLQKPMPERMSWTNAVRKLMTIGSDVIVSYGAPATLTAMKETSDIPIVFAGVYDPESMRMTGKNATGISSTVSVEKVIRNLSRISKLSKLGVIFSKKKIKDVNALLLTTTSAGMINIKDIVEIARRDKIPTAALMGGGEDAGIVLTIAADPKEQGKELAAMVEKVLGGADPSDITLRKPRQVEIVINLKEAKAMGLRIPADILKSAGRVIR
jgi:putative ABC transport system substrate-binding protein